jgi:hypothetical protein
MRQNGQQWEDPKPGEEQGVPLAPPGHEFPASMQKAIEACKRYLPNGGQPLMTRNDPVTQKAVKACEAALR